MPEGMQPLAEWCARNFGFGGLLIIAIALVNHYFGEDLRNVLRAFCRVLIGQAQLVESLKVEQPQQTKALERIERKLSEREPAVT